MSPLLCGQELTNPRLVQGRLAQSVWWVLGSGRSLQHLPEFSVQTVRAGDRARQDV